MTVSRSDNSLKTPLNKSLNDFAAKKVAAGIQATGKALPCSVASIVSPGIVTVKFEVNAAPYTLPNVTMPIQGWQYVRYPIAVGEKGVCYSADARLGGVTGLGSGVADFTPVGNLQALAFCPLGSTAWPANKTTNAVEIYGNLLVGAAALGFYGTTPISKPTISGPLSAVEDASAKAVLTSIIATLASLGLVINGTS